LRVLFIRNIYWIDRVVASYHCSVVKVRVTKRTDFTRIALACQGISRRKYRCHLSCDIGTSDCKTNRLVSLTRDCSLSFQRSVRETRSL